MINENDNNEVNDLVNADEERIALLNDELAATPGSCPNCGSTRGLVERTTVRRMRLFDWHGKLEMEMDIAPTVQVKPLLECADCGQYFQHIG